MSGHDAGGAFGDDNRDGLDAFGNPVAPPHKHRAPIARTPERRPAPRTGQPRPSAPAAARAAQQPSPGAAAPDPLAPPGAAAHGEAEQQWFARSDTSTGPRTSGLAMVALVVSLMGFFSMGMFSIISLFIAIGALRQIRTEPHVYEGATIARIALVLSILGILFALAIGGMFYYMVSRPW